MLAPIVAWYPSKADLPDAALAARSTGEGRHVLRRVCAGRKPNVLVLTLCQLPLLLHPTVPQIMARDIGTREESQVLFRFESEETAAEWLARLCAAPGLIRAGDTKLRASQDDQAAPVRVVKCAGLHSSNAVATLL